MARVIIKKAITTEKSHLDQDKGIWTFLVSNDSNKIEIKQAVKQLFDVEVESVNTTSVRKKIRKLGKSRIHTRRAQGKIARVTLKDKKKKIDMTKAAKK
jgi:large subunit ribosomal protein L23